MTELYVNCNEHGRVHVKEWTLSEFFYAECGCKFHFNSGYVRNLTEERKRENGEKFVDDHKGKRYQDGSYI